MVAASPMGWQQLDPRSIPCWPDLASFRGAVAVLLHVPTPPIRIAPSLGEATPDLGPVRPDLLRKSAWRQMGDDKCSLVGR